MARSAPREAMSHYQTAIALLETAQAAQPCADVEFGLLLRLGNAASQTERFTSACAKASYELTEAGIALDEARRELENVRPEEWQLVAGVDPRIAVLIYLNRNLMCRGLLSSADACARETLGIAEQRP